MSQLFTLQFPRYHFDQQKEFTLQLNAKVLPFTYEITNKIVVVDRLLDPTEEQTNNTYQKQRDQWIRSGLQEGVRIITINNKDITNDSGTDNTPITRQYITNLISEMQTKSGQIDLTFREEILEFDDSVSLGLTYNESTKKDYEDEEEEETKMTPSHHKSKSAQLLGFRHIITNRQIAASSCSEGHEPSQCRLNNPKSYWKPSIADATLNNSWISVDLKEKKMITKLRVQGTQHKTSYVKSLWIDFSNDGSSWTCHNEAEVKCVYDKTEDNVFGVEDTESKDKFADIILWPPIHSRFVRIRPSAYHHDIALRFDVYGPPTNRLEIARVVKYGDLADEDRHCALSKVRHCNTNTSIIQVDCRAVMRRALDQAEMSYVGFVETSKNNYLCVFSTADLTATERTIEELLNIGIGRAMGVVGICPMQFRRPVKAIKHKDPDNEEKENEEFKRKHGVTAGFYSSIKSRQIVDQLVDNTTQSAEFTYDYMSMLLVADVIAAMGLGTNSAVIVVASMLVSPIMGPVLALTFGVHLRKFKFAKALAMLGLKNEIWSLLICILVGFVVGFILISITENEAGEDHDTPWPTTEMSSRGDPTGLATGAIVAFASGVGVALSVVGDYMASVIGVAISASLLPPAVNCGMLWAMSAYALIYPSRAGSHDSGELYTAGELAFMGLISIILTIENIILVFLASWMMFCIKDVTFKKDRGFDPSRQGVYQSITSFKDRYDDIRMRSTNYSLSRSKPSMKHLAIKDDTEEYLGKSLDQLTMDTEAKGRTLKKQLMSYNTMKKPARMGGGGLKRLETELDGIMEDEELDAFDDYGESPIPINVQKVPTDSTVGVIEENRPLMTTNATDDAVGVMETEEDDK